MSSTELLGLTSVAALCAVMVFANSAGAQPQADNLARLASLETELSGLEHDVQLLEDTKAIKRLQRAYGYYVDKKLADQIEALFSDAPDTTAELGGYGVYVGKARIGEFYRRLMGGQGLKPGELYNHMILQGVVHVADDDRTAKGRWRALIQTGEAGKTAIWAEGPYENEYVKENGVWKFSKVHWYQTVAAPYDPGWHKAPLPLNPPLADFPPDRPPSEVYKSYPSAYQPPYHYKNPVSGRCEPGVCNAHDAVGGAAQPRVDTAPAPQTGTDPMARVAAQRQRLAAIDARAERVDDINQVENLQNSYGYYTDKMLWDEVLDLMTDDATMEIGPSGVYVGKDSIRRYLYSLSGGRQGPIEGVLFEHLQLQPIVTLSADGLSAKGRFRALIMTGTYGSGSAGNWGEGPYENEYVRQNGVWKISKIHWYATFYVPYEGGWLNPDKKAVDDYALGRGVQPDRPPSETYDAYPGIYLPPFSFKNPVSGQ
jgi:SnoaL-like domain